jgi:hypothetical protein
MYSVVSNERLYDAIFTLTITSKEPIRGIGCCMILYKFLSRYDDIDIDWCNTNMLDIYKQNNSNSNNNNNHNNNNHSGSSTDL